MESKSKLVTLKGKKSFESLKTTGYRSKPSSWLLLNYKKNDLNYNRLGWTISSKVTHSVVRNRLKRWCREFFKELNRSYKGPTFDINLVFREQKGEFYQKLTFKELRAVLERGWHNVTSKSH